MHKLQYENKNINIGKLHIELGDLGVVYYLTYDEENMYLQFPNLYKRETEQLDDEGNVIDTTITYEKSHFETVTEQQEQINENGEVETVEVELQKEVFETFDFESLQNQINEIINNHDPVPLPSLPTADERLEQLENAMLMMLM